MGLRFYRFIQLFSLLILLNFVGPTKLSGQQDERWKLSVNDDSKPIEILMDLADEGAITYLFDITSDTLNMAFVAEEAIDWKKHGISVYALPGEKEVLKLNLDNSDLENVQIVFYRMWKAMPKSFKNVTTFFELREYGTTENGRKVEQSIIRFKMKRPRQGNSINL